MILNEFSLETLSISIVSVLGAFGLCLRGSRCKKIKCCGIYIERDIVNNKEKEKDIEEGL